MAGVTTTGFLSKTLGELIDEGKAVWRSVFNPSVNVADRSRNGQLIAGFAGPLAEVWKLGEEITTFFTNPSGVMLDALSKLTGTVRLPATKSQVVLTLTGVPTTLVVTGKVASVNGSSAQFATTADATITAVTAWATLQTIALGARRTANGNVYQAKQGGVTAAVGTGPAGTGSSIADGSVIWFFLGVGTGAVDVNAESTVEGPVQGYAGTITVISTPVSGWNGVYNVFDAAPGAFEESDPLLRARRAREVAAQGTSPLDAIRAKLQKVAGVTSAIVFENTTEVTVDGVGPHSIECLVDGGADADIAQAIFDNIAAGIATSGTESEVVNDSYGNAHTIKFSRVTLVNMWVTVELYIDPNAYPTDGDDQVKAAIVAYGDALGSGRSVFAGQIGAAILDKDDDGVQRIPGIFTHTELKVDDVDPPVTDFVALTVRQRPVFDTSRIEVSTVTSP